MRKAQLYVDGRFSIFRFIGSAAGLFGCLGFVGLVVICCCGGVILVGADSTVNTPSSAPSISTPAPTGE